MVLLIILFSLFSGWHGDGIGKVITYFFTCANKVINNNNNNKETILHFLLLVQLIFTLLGYYFTTINSLCMNISTHFDF